MELELNFELQKIEINVNFKYFSNCIPFAPLEKQFCRSNIYKYLLHAALFFSALLQ